MSSGMPDTHRGQLVSGTRDGFKQLGEHVEGCHAAAREDGIAFVVHEGMDYRRKRNGDRGGSTAWHVFRCNDTRCEALLLVRWDALCGFINHPPRRHDA